MQEREGGAGDREGAELCWRGETGVAERRWRREIGNVGKKTLSTVLSVADSRWVLLPRAPFILDHVLMAMRPW